MTRSAGPTKAPADARLSARRDLGAVRGWTPVQEMPDREREPEPEPV